jgi:GT2 family glycosyltransferase
MNFMNQSSTCDLSIVIVSWNVWPLLRRCLSSIERASLPGDAHLRRFEIARPGEGERGREKRDAAAQPIQSPASIPHFLDFSQATLEVIVVDNASQDDTPARIAAHFPWVRVIASDKNLGFTGGNNRGFAISRGRFVYFLNPDTELGGAKDRWREATARQREGEKGREEEARKRGERELMPSDHTQSPISNLPISQSLALLYAAISADRTIGVIGPQLRYGDGALQPSVRRFPMPLTGFFESTWLGRAWPSNPWARKMLMTDWPADRAGEVDWLVGAAMLCRREALETVATPDGPFDEGFFMYSEELDLCRRIKQMGWRVVYEPAALVIHHEGKSSEQASTQRHIHFNTSKVRYWRKWFGPRWGEALRRYLLLEYRVQLWQEQLKLWLGHRPDLRRSRIAAYREVIRSRLEEQDWRLETGLVERRSPNL